MSDGAAWVRQRCSGWLAGWPASCWLQQQRCDPDAQAPLRSLPAALRVLTPLLLLPPGVFRGALWQPLCSGGGLPQEERDLQVCWKWGGRCVVVFGACGCTAVLCNAAGEG